MHATFFIYNPLYWVSQTTCPSSSIFFFAKLITPYTVNRHAPSMADVNLIPTESGSLRLELYLLMEHVYFDHEFGFYIENTSVLV